jgi:predicted enzyme related to lactoylglutathione lyase
LPPFLAEASGPTRRVDRLAPDRGGRRHSALPDDPLAREHDRVPHRSRLAVLLLDLPPDQHAAGRDFWSAATGHPAEPDATDEEWASLGSFAGGFHLEVQRTGAGTPPRWHVDIETDDIPAEVARLEALGARRLADMGRFWQLTDPAGLVFCVVGIQTGDEFERHATTWP